jgi:acyl carrier protein
MDRGEISTRMKQLLVSELGLDESKINDGANFEEDLEVDSLGVVELLMALEDEFGVKIPDEDAESIHTVGQAVDLVHGKLAG